MDRERNQEKKKGLCVSQSLSFIPSLCHSLSLYLTYVSILVFSFFLIMPKTGYTTKDNIVLNLWMLLFLPLIHQYVYLALYLYFSFFPFLYLSNQCQETICSNHSLLFTWYNLIHIPFPDLGEEKWGGGCQTEMTDMKFYPSTCVYKNIISLDICHQMSRHST